MMLYPATAERMDFSEYSPGHLLDPEQIMMLLEAGADDSLDLFNEILILFEEESRAKLAEMKNCRDGEQYDSLGRAAHALAGSSANIGARQLWLQAKEVENHCRSQSGPKAAEMIPELEDIFSETLVQLRLFVESLDSPGP